MNIKKCLILMMKRVDIKAQYNLPNKRWKITYLFVVDDNLISKDVFKVKVNITTLKNLTRDLLFK